jgi:hypothetical protein
MLGRREMLVPAGLAVRAAQVEQVEMVEPEGLVEMVVVLVKQVLWEIVAIHKVKIAVGGEAAGVAQEQQMTDQQLMKIILFTQTTHQLSTEHLPTEEETHQITASQFL